MQVGLGFADTAAPGSNNAWCIAAWSFRRSRFGLNCSPPSLKIASNPHTISAASVRRTTPVGSRLILIREWVCKDDFECNHTRSPALPGTQFTYLCTDQ